MSSAGLHADNIPFGGPARSDRFCRVAEGHYQLTSDNLNTELDIDHVRRERHQLYGELTVHCGLPGVRTVRGILFVATVNLSNLRDRDGVARALCDRTQSKDLEAWRALVDELAIHVAAAEREGDPGVELKDVPARDARGDRWLRTLGFTLPERLPAMLFGDGDVLKTMAADAVAVDLARRGVPVGIVDAEMTVDDHRDRVWALAGGQVPAGVFYLGASRPLTYDADRIAEFVRRHAVQYLIFDSVAFLCHDKPESADAAMSYFRAVRSLGTIGSLHLAHTTKGEDGDQKPFGSTFWFNSVRALWYAKRADSAAGAKVAEIGYYPRKFNVGTRPPAHALRFTFADHGTTVVPIEPSTIQALAAGVPLKDRVRSVLRKGARSIEELKRDLPDVDAETLSRTIRRHTNDKARFQLFTKLPDGRFGLRDRGTS